MNHSNELFKQIEDTEFAAAIGVISGFKHLLRVLDNDSFLKTFYGLVIATSQSDQILRRIQTLVLDNPEPTYLHPKDAALTGYLYILSRTQPNLVPVAVEAILSIPNLWWAKRMAHYLHETLPAQIETIWTDISPQSLIRETSNAGNTVSVRQFSIINKLKTKNISNAAKPMLYQRIGA